MPARPRPAAGGRPPTGQRLPPALVVGSGGREHALAWALERSGRFSRVWVAPGNGGTPHNVPVELADPGAVDSLIAFAREQDVGLVVIGPEAPLAAGMADRLREAGLFVVGPSRAAARIESSKAFAKVLMDRAGVPTAPFRIFSEPERALAYVRKADRPLVVKADGLAAGKGALVCDTARQAAEAVESLMVRRSLGDAGRTVVIEERLQGSELSIMVITDGERAVALPPARDYKRLLDGDAGPNTGGMGAVAPVRLAGARANAGGGAAEDPEAHVSLEDVLSRIVYPTLQALAAAGSRFTGILYAGLMLTPQGPFVLEFNCRAGDPETQAQVPLVDPESLAEALMAAAGVPGFRLPDGPHALWPRAGESEAEVRHAVCVVLACAGYPAKSRTGDVIERMPPEDSGEQPRSLVFHAGSRARPDGWIETAGGRVLNVVGLGASRAEARRRAYETAARVHFAGMQYRTDIGK
ncbi:MAG: phosphoribosylamine--glycine ligase [Bacillota bacterium]